MYTLLRFLAMALRIFSLYLPVYIYLPSTVIRMLTSYRNNSQRSTKPVFLTKEISFIWTCKVISAEHILMRCHSKLCVTCIFCRCVTGLPIDVAGPVFCTDTMACINQPGYTCKDERCVCDPERDTGLLSCRGREYKSFH